MTRNAILTLFHLSLLLSSAALPAQMSVVQQSGFRDANSNLVSGVQVCAQAISEGRPISVRAGGGVGLIARPVCVSATNGTWSMSLPDGATSSPPDATWSLTAIDGSGKNLLAGYVIQPHSKICTLGGSAVDCRRLPASDWCNSGTCVLDPPNARAHSSAATDEAKQGDTGKPSPLPAFSGLWIPSKRYHQGDVVGYNDFLFIASQTGSGNVPGPGSAFWNQFTAPLAGNCPILRDNQRCILESGLNASNHGDVMTKTVTASSAGTHTLAVESCDTFLPGNGFSLNASYVGMVLSCSGTTLRAASALPSGWGAGTVLRHDETAVIQSLISSMAANGGQIFFPNGLYRVNGPPQNSGSAEDAGMLMLPSAAAYGAKLPPMIEWIGLTTPTGVNAPYGTILQRDRDDAHLLSGYNGDSTAQYPGLTNYWFGIRNITLRAPDLPRYDQIHATWFMALHAEHLWCDTPHIPTPDRNNNSACAAYPHILNNVSNLGDDLTSVGYGASWVLTEHTKIGSLYSANCNVGFAADNGVGNGTPPTYFGNSVSIQNAWVFLCHYGMAAGKSSTVINVATFDSELNNLGEIYDPGNLIRGSVAINNPYSPFQIRVVGGMGLDITNLRPTIVRRYLDSSPGTEEHVATDDPAQMVVYTQSTKNKAYSGFVVGPYAGGLIDLPSTWTGGAMKAPTGGMHLPNSLVLKADAKELHVGTSKPYPLLFYTNDIMRMAIDPSGYIAFPSLPVASGSCYALYVDAKGTLLRGKSAMACPQ